MFIKLNETDTSIFVRVTPVCFIITNGETGIIVPVLGYGTDPLTILPHKPSFLPTNVGLFPKDYIGLRRVDYCNVTKQLVFSDSATNNHEDLFSSPNFPASQPKRLPSETRNFFRGGWKFRADSSVLPRLASSPAHVGRPSAYTPRERLLHFTFLLPTSFTSHHMTQQCRATKRNVKTSRTERESQTGAGTLLRFTTGRAATKDPPERQLDPGLYPHENTHTHTHTHAHTLHHVPVHEIPSKHPHAPSGHPISLAGGSKWRTHCPPGRSKSVFRFSSPAHPPFLGPSKFLCSRQQSRPHSSECVCSLHHGLVLDTDSLMLPQGQSSAGGLCRGN